jgi:guanidinoacetate N-methyltransferase
MEPWQKGYMDEFAEVVTVNGGRVLEIGFGSGFSANAIQKRNRVKEHVIVEPNKNILDDVRQFAESATATVTPVRGLWQDVIDQFEDSSFDGIFFDGSPFNEDELYNRQFHFGEHAFRLLKKGGIYTYCNLTGFGQLRGRFADWETFFRESQLPSLQKIGFTDIQYKIVAVDPPLNHEKYRFKEAMIPIAIR